MGGMRGGGIRTAPEHKKIVQPGSCSEVRQKIVQPTIAFYRHEKNSASEYLFQVRAQKNSASDYLF